eukprot:1832340-Pyramimonas_sp.AAC.1
MGWGQGAWIDCAETRVFGTPVIGTPGVWVLGLAHVHCEIVDLLAASQLRDDEEFPSSFLSSILFNTTLGPLEG